MTQAAIASQVHQTLDVHRGLTTKITLNGVLSVNRLTDLQHLSVREILNATSMINAQTISNLTRLKCADTMNIGKRDDHALVCGDINPGNTSQLSSPCSTGDLDNNMRNMSTRDKPLSQREKPPNAPMKPATSAQARRENLNGHLREVRR